MSGIFAERRAVGSGAMYNQVITGKTWCRLSRFATVADIDNPRSNLTRMLEKKREELAKSKIPELKQLLRDADKFKGMSGKSKSALIDRLVELEGDRLRARAEAAKERRVAELEARRKAAARQNAEQTRRESRR